MSLHDRRLSWSTRTITSPGRTPARAAAGRDGIPRGHRRPWRPEPRRDPAVHGERERHVDRDAGEDDNHALPDGLAVERAGRVDRDVGLAALQIPRDSLILEPRHLHVAAER